MTKIEALELELAARKLVDGTGLEWWEVIRFIGHHKGNGATCSQALTFIYPREQYEHALGVVEGKPVWEDDIIYDAAGDACKAKRHYTYPGAWSWNPPKPKTVMVELPIKHVEYWDSQGEFLRSAPEPTPLDVKSMTFYAACHKALENLK